MLKLGVGLALEGHEANKTKKAIQDSVSVLVLVSVAKTVAKAKPMVERQRQVVASGSPDLKQLEGKLLLHESCDSMAHHVAESFSH